MVRVSPLFGSNGSEVHLLVRDGRIEHGQVQARAVVPELRLEAELVGRHFFRPERGVVGRARVGTAGLEAGAVLGIDHRVLAKVVGDIDHRIEAAPAVLERKVGRRTIDDVQAALLVIAGIAATGSQVQALQRLRGPRGLAEHTQAVGPGLAGAVDAHPRKIQRVGRRIHRIAVATWAPHQHVRGLRIVTGGLVVVERATEELHLRGVADELEFLAVLVLVDLGQAVATERRSCTTVRRDRVNQAHVELALGEFAV